MNATRTLLWIVGILFVVAGVYSLYFQTGLSRWVSIGVLTAGMLLFLGLAVLGFATGAPSDAPVIEEREVRPGSVREETNGRRR